jgi:hypothetical protein
MNNNFFEIGTKVIVTRNNGTQIEGTISNWDVNVCTFKTEYDVDYFNPERGTVYTMIGIPKEAIKSIN